MGGLDMNWETIILAILGCSFVGDIFVRLVFKSDRRVANAKADVAESEAMKAAVEVRKTMEEAHAVQCQQYEERIKDLHSTIDKLNDQLDRYVERDASKEARFDNQTEKLRDVQGKYANALMELADEHSKNTEYEKRIGELELELERKRCDRRRCPFRLPPNAETPTSIDISIDEYFKKSKYETEDTHTEVRLDCGHNV